MKRSPNTAKSSRVQEVIDWIIARQFATSAEIARQFGLYESEVRPMLARRKNREDGVALVGDFWQKFVEPAPMRSVALPKTPPTNKEPWRGHGNAGPIRPGAFDYREIPSRIGSRRVLPGEGGA